MCVLRRVCWLCACVRLWPKNIDGLVLCLFFWYSVVFSVEKLEFSAERHYVPTVELEKNNGIFHGLSENVEEWNGKACIQQWMIPG